MKAQSFSERDAMAFVTTELADEAVRAGEPLTETERRMLYFSESGPDAPEFADVVDAFGRECDDSEYERRIGDLIRAARKRADPAKATTWSAALERLKASDNYLCVILGQTYGFSPETGLSWRGAFAVVVLIAGFVIFPDVLARYFGREPTNDVLFYYSWVCLTTGAVVYMAGRGLFGAERFDGFIERIIELVVGRRSDDGDQR